MMTRDDIRFSLELMDIRRGDTLLLHSALTAIGPVEGGADAVIDAFWTPSARRARWSCPR